MKKDERMFYCYLDDFDLVTIIVPTANYRKDNNYKLIGNDEIIDLDIVECVNLGNEMKIVCSFEAYIELRKIYHVIDDYQEKSELYTGKIVRTELFDNIYYYKKNDLGITYSRESSKFKIWTPVAKSVKLELVYPDKTRKLFDVPYSNSGVWRLVVEGDLEGCAYRYHVYVNGKEQTVTDPYAIASRANGSFNYVIDKDKLYRIRHFSTFSGNPLDAVIYEMNVRDFTMDISVPFKNRGKYLGVIEKGIKTKSGNPAGIDHLTRMGITHVQLMPIFDFGGVDEIKPDEYYNWGYNPEQYFVPEGWYSTDPDDPYCRLNELRMMIDGLHKSGISVVMDVVYNHVYDVMKFPFEKLVPGYAYQVDRDGIYTNVSGCNNDLATNRKMIRKLIIDSVVYWASEFQVDGFRFDLMGLIDFETMNELRQELHLLSEHIIVYGEGWKMHQSNLADRMAHMQNKKVLYTIGFFNDKFRDSIKGKTFDPKAAGYATGNVKEVETVREMVLGSALNRYMFKYTTQSVNYVECHDNMTFFDKAYMISGNDDFARKCQRLGTAMVILSQGIPFLHSGQEFYRSKHNIDNSFKAGDCVNKLDWSLLDRYNDDVDFIQKLIRIRKDHPCFRLKSSSELTQYADAYILKSKSLMIHYSQMLNLIIVFKPLGEPETIILPEGYNVLLASRELSKNVMDNTYEMDDIGVVIFNKESE